MLELAEGSLHVWRASLVEERYDAAAALSDEERSRAARFLFDDDRERWVRGRAILRDLLGGYLGVDPGSVDLIVGVNGKPSVDGAAVSFNLSHSGNLALYAFAHDGAVGVDVEVLDRRVDVVALAQRVLGHDEALRLRALPEREREREFLRSWVRHEAAVKCRASRLGTPVQLQGLSFVDLEVGPRAAAGVALTEAAGEVCLREFHWDTLPSARTAGTAHARASRSPQPPASVAGPARR